MRRIFTYGKDLQYKIRDLIIYKKLPDPKDHQLYRHMLNSKSEVEKKILGRIINGEEDMIHQVELEIKLEAERRFAPVESS